MPNDGNKIAKSSDLPMALPPFFEERNNAEAVKLANDLLHTTREVRVLLGQYYLFRSFLKCRELALAESMTEADNGIRIVLGSLMRTLVVSSAALFDADPRTRNLPKILRDALAPANLSTLRSLHEHSATVDQSIERLTKYQRRLKHSTFKGPISRVVHLRRTRIAHFDAEPVDSPYGRAVRRDFSHVIAAAAVVTGELNFTVLGRRVDQTGLRDILRQQADALPRVIQRGLSVRPRTC